MSVHRVHAPHHPAYPTGFRLKEVTSITPRGVKRSFIWLPPESEVRPYAQKPDWMSPLVWAMLGVQAADVTIERATPLEFRSTSHAPAAANDLAAEFTPTGVDLSLGLTAGVADDAAMNSDKFDYGANRAPRWNYISAIEWFAAPTTGERVDHHVGGSPDVTADEASPGYLDGVDGDYTGTPGTLDEGLAQLDFVGALIASADAIVQIQRVGVHIPYHRYGELVVTNRSGAVICGTDDIETSIVAIPMVDDVATS